MYPQDIRKEDIRKKNLNIELDIKKISYKDLKHTSHKRFPSKTKLSSPAIKVPKEIVYCLTLNYLLIKLQFPLRCKPFFLLLFLVVLILLTTDLTLCNSQSIDICLFFFSTLVIYVSLLWTNISQVTSSPTLVSSTISIWNWVNLVHSTTIQVLIQVSRSKIWFLLRHAYPSGSYVEISMVLQHHFLLSLPFLSPLSF